jgi:hypothetical protein
LAQLRCELGDVSRDSFRSADRFGKKLLRLDNVLRSHRIDGLAGLAGRLVDASAEFGPEPQGEWRPRRPQQIHDAFEAQFAKVVDRVGRQPQRRDRQRPDPFGTMSFRNEEA